MAHHIHTGNAQKADALNEHARHLLAKPVMFVKSNRSLVLRIHVHTNNMITVHNGPLPLEMGT